MIEVPLCDDYPNLFDPISARIVENARAVGIEVRPTPHPEGCYYREVLLSTPKGHYLTLQATGAQIIAVDDYRPAANTYEELIPGYRLVEICEMLAGDVPGEMDPAHAGRFVSIAYLPNG